MPPVIAAVASVAAAVGAAATAVVGALGLTGLVSALGMSALGFIATTVSIGATLLAGRPKMPQNSPENVNRLRATIDPRTPRKTVVGNTAMATDIRDEEFTDNQTYFHRFIVCASHPCESIDEIWFDDKLAWTLALGVINEFVGYLTVQPVPLGNTAINISARMGGTRKFTGLANVHLRYKLTGNAKKTDSPFAQSIPSRITIKGKAARLYDPRMDSTVPGGSGTQRADDQATWVWDDDACRNPALALLFYLLGWRTNGLLMVGKGIPANRIDLESFIVAANICDEVVSKGGVTTEPRYRCDGVWSEADSPTVVMDALKACMNADLDDVDGKLRVTIFQDDTAVSDADFTADDVLGEFEWTPASALEDTFNVIRGIYTDPSLPSLYQQIDYPQVEVASPDGIERIETLNLPMVESDTQAQRLASLRLERQNFSGIFKAEFQATAWRVQKNSIVRLTFPPLGFVDKVFRVAEMDLRADGIVPLVLREESSSIYVAPAFQPPLVPIDGTSHDPSLDPIIDAIGDRLAAIRNARILNPRDAGDIGRTLLIATDAGASATISVARHDWDYPGGTALVTRALGTITGLAFSTTYYVYFDDATLANGTPTYQATTVADDALNSTAHPDRHPLGSITTPADGAADTEGDGAAPGYGYPAETTVPAWIIAAATNFNANNDGNGLEPSPVTSLSLASTLSSDASARLHAQWSFTPSADPANSNSIDGYLVGLYSKATSAAWTYGAAFDGSITWGQTPAHAKGMIWDGLPPDKHYWVVVFAYRRVRTDVDTDGVILSVVTQTPAGSPLRPATFANYTGYVGGQAASVIASTATNFNADNDGNGATPPAATGPSLGSVTYTDSTAGLLVQWTYTNSTTPSASNNIDGFLVGLYAASSSAAWTYSSVYDEQMRWVDMGATTRMAWLLGPADKHYWAVVIPYRKVRSDVAATGIIKAAAAQITSAHQPASTPNFTGALAGYTAASVVVGSNRAYGSINSDGTIVTDKVVAASIANNAINAQGYEVQTSTLAMGLSETTWMVGLNSVTVGAEGVAIVRVVISYYYQKTGPVQGTDYSANFAVALELPGGGYSAGTTYTLKERWDGPSTGSSVNMELRTAVLEHRFTGLTPGTYKPAVRIVTTSNCALVSPGPRYYNLRVPKGDS